jgi:hypothetical protein
VQHGHPIRDWADVKLVANAMSAHNASRLSGGGDVQATVALVLEGAPVPALIVTATDDIALIAFTHVCHEISRPQAVRSPT